MKNSRLLVLMIFLFLSGCALFQSQTNSFQVNVKQSEAIQLQPVDQKAKTILYQFQNLVPLNNQLGSLVRQKLNARGYRFVKSTEDAHYQVTITQQQIGLATNQQLTFLLKSDYAGQPIPNLQAIQPVVKLPTDVDVVNLSNLTPVIVVDLQISEISESNAQEPTAWNRYQTRFIGYSQEPSVNYSDVQDRLNGLIADNIANIM